MWNRSRVFIAYLCAVPLALVLGFLAASPGEFSFVLIGLLLFFLALPLLIAWHHACLILFWNSAFCALFLPGHPDFWLVLAGMSFGISMLNYIICKRPFLVVSEMNRPLCFLALVILITALFRGGIPLKALGGTGNGGRYYVFTLGAIVGYYALTACAIPPHKARLLTGLYFLSAISFALGNLAYAAGPAFYPVYYLVSAGSAATQAASDYGLTSIARWQGFGPACIGAMCFLLARYGVSDLTRWKKPWRIILLTGVVAASFVAGFRSVLIIMLLIFALQIYFEGLWKTRTALILAVAGILALILMVLFAQKLPFVMQRCLSVLPVKISPEVRADAEGSTAWRVQMWNVVLRDVPHYLLLGRGYGFDATEMDLVMQATRSGLLPDYEESLLAGDYHSGPLSILVPFGLAGAGAFLWLLWAGFKVLHANYTHGQPRLRRINTLLLSFYAAKVICFFFVFGAFNSELTMFLGPVALSISLNAGLRRKAKLRPPADVVRIEQLYAVENF